MNCEAQSVGNLADVTIIDRDSGVALHVKYYRGEYGVNVLSGADAAWDQGGYVDRQPKNVSAETSRDR